MYKNGFVLIALLTFLFGATNTIAEQQSFSGDTKKFLTGKKIYSDYCSRCHGENADGRGKAVAMYVKMRAARPSNFKVKFFSIRPKEYLMKIVRDGGEKHSLSQFMPPFGGELDTQQINDVVYFIQNVSLYDLHKTEKHPDHIVTGKN